MGENGEYSRHYKEGGFKCWFLDHLLHNHLGCLLKSYILVLNAKFLNVILSGWGLGMSILISSVCVFLSHESLWISA